mmetsp:Transcript_64001/g.139156  ORF Transcript_64001/g.139156 Transcript_64001/m.139156 type:complete len:431 (+) Transcript_64001:55-1347(+)
MARAPDPLAWKLSGVVQGAVKSRSLATFLGRREKPRSAIGGGTAHLIIVAIDYRKDPCTLSCTSDGKNMIELAKKCGIRDVTVLFDEQATCPNVEGAIRNVGSRCGPADTLIFYYSGHGTNVQDKSGDEADGLDEAFVLLDDTGRIDSQNIVSQDASGKVRYKALMTDDIFSDIVTSSLRYRSTCTVIISDCCHSGTIGDLGAPSWQGRPAVSISGCRDFQTSGDVGVGGIFSHSMMRAIEKLQQLGNDNYSIGKLFSATLVMDDQLFDSEQDITIDRTAGISESEIKWPLIPLSSYQAPYRAKPGAGASLGGQAGSSPSALASPQYQFSNPASPPYQLSGQYQYQPQPTIQWASPTYAAQPAPEKWWQQQLQVVADNSNSGYSVTPPVVVGQLPNQGYPGAQLHFMHNWEPTNGFKQYEEQPPEIHLLC